MLQFSLKLSPLDALGGGSGISGSAPTQRENSMGSKTEDEQILKQDALGRVRVPKQKREELVDAFEASGIEWQGFCRAAWGQVSDFCQLDSEAAKGSW